MTILWNAATPDETVYENEFFNRSVRAVYAYGVTRVPDPLPETTARRATATGNLGVHVQYVLGQDVVGKVVASDPQIGVDLYRVDGPLVIADQRARPLSERHVVGPARHLLALALHGRHADGAARERRARSSRSPQTVVAREHGSVVGRASIPPTAATQLVVPLHARGGTCSVEFDVARTLVPGHGDARALGAHFLFTYEP